MHNTTIRELGYDPEEEEEEKRQGEAKADLETQATAFNSGTGPQKDPKEEEDGE